LADQGRTDEAAALVSGCAENADPMIRRWASGITGLLHLCAGQPAEAHVALTRAVRGYAGAGPPLATHEAGLALAAADRGDVPRALEVLARSRTRGQPVTPLSAAWLLVWSATARLRCGVTTFDDEAPGVQAALRSTELPTACLIRQVWRAEAPGR